jgi:hypothetical protein
LDGVSGGLISPAIITALKGPKYRIGRQLDSRKVQTAVDGASNGSNG